MKKLLQKSAAVLLAASLAAGCALPALGAEQPTVKKEETAYLILNEDGSVREQIVSDWLHCDSGLRQVRDKSSLRDIENLKSDVEPKRQGNELVWDTADHDLYYQGKSDGSAPVSVSIAYTLDGTGIPASQLEGKSGHLNIHVSLKNNEGEKVDISGEERMVYTPFFTVAAAMLPADFYTNVTAEHGTVQTDAKTQLACFLALPGISESLSGLIPDSASQIGELLLDEIDIEADVTDCVLPTFLFAASPSLEGLSGSLNEPELSGRMDDLKQATRELQDGAGALDGAVASLEEKLAEFAEGYAEFDAGVDTALSGSQQLTQGSGNLLENAELLSEKSAELAAGALQLQNGTAQLSGLLNNQLVPGLSQAGAKEAALKAKMEGLSAQLGSVSVPDLSGMKSQLASGVGQVFDGAAYNAAFAASKVSGETVKAGCKNVVSQVLSQAADTGAESAENAAASVQSQLLGSLAGVLQAHVDSGEISGETMQAILEEMSACSYSVDMGASSGSPLAGAADRINAAIDANVGVNDEAASAIANGVTAQMADARAAAVAQVSGAVPDIDTSQFSALLGEFQSLSGDAAELLDSVDLLTGALYNAGNPGDPNTVVGAAGALAVGAESLSGGASALSDGTGVFADGVGQLQSGAGTLYTGMLSLSSSSKTVSESISQFQTGGAELKNGTAQLKQGMDSYADEAIDKLTSLADPDSALGRTLSALKDRAEAYQGSGCGADTDMTVKLVMRTTATDAATPQTEEASEPVEAQQPGLWDRIKNLFS